MEIKLPELGEGVTEGELIKWLVKPGDEVKHDQAIAEVMTDKATVEVPSPHKGKVTAVKAKEGDTIKVGDVLIEMETSAGASSKDAPKAEASKKETPKSTPPAGATSAGAPTFARSSSNGGEIYPPVASSRVLATPSTRRLAREMNVDINELQGSGLAGRVTRDDVARTSGGGAGLETYAPGKSSIPRPAYQGLGGASEERVPLKGIRKKIAEKMQMAKHVIPHFTLMDEADVTELVQLRAGIKAKLTDKSVKITYLPFIMKALIATVRDFSEFNASIDDAAQEIVYKKYFNIGFAADTPQGLLVPVIKDADRKSILDISREIVELSDKARAGKLGLEEMKGATMSITNIGSIGGTYATPIINHPEVMILGMYKIVERPVVRDGEIHVAQVMNVSVTADHRLIDGAVAARFITAFVDRLENPGLLMMDLA